MGGGRLQRGSELRGGDAGTTPELAHRGGGHPGTGETRTAPGWVLGDGARARGGRAKIGGFSAEGGDFALSAARISTDAQHPGVASRVHRGTPHRGGGDQERAPPRGAGAGRPQGGVVPQQPEAHVDDSGACLDQPVEARRNGRRVGSQRGAKDLGVEELEVGVPGLRPEDCGETRAVIGAVG